MLEHLFGSKTRVRLLRLFLDNPSQPYFVRELTRKIGAQINAVRNELENLVKMDIIQITTEDGADEVVVDGRKKTAVKSAQRKKYYKLNLDCVVYPELRALFLKARVLLEKDFVRKISQSGTMSYFLMTGYFVGNANADVDLFIVGRVNRTKLEKVIKSFEKEIGHELNYAIMTPQEYKYRRDVTDVFLYNLLESKKIVVIDKISEKIGAPAL